MRVFLVRSIGDSGIHTDTRRLEPRVVGWAENVANGREDRRETLIGGKFVEGWTIGPAPAPDITLKGTLEI